jgi:ketosteroid isomerase-like protein
MTPDTAQSTDVAASADRHGPSEVVLALLDGVCRLVGGDREQIERLAGLYAEQALVLHPMAPLGLAPLRTRDDLRRHFAQGPGAAGGPDRFEAVDVVLHRTADPEVVVAEFAYLVGYGGREERVPCVFIVRVRDGLIVESHDYNHHLAMARVAGRLPQLLEALAAGDR